MLLLKHTVKSAQCYTRIGQYSSATRMLTNALDALSASNLPYEDYAGQSRVDLLIALAETLLEEGIYERSKSVLEGSATYVDKALYELYGPRNERYVSLL